jgi:phosphoribosylformylglycinamidine synthase
MKVKINITLKNSVLDPQGKAIENALQNIGMKQITDIRQGKLIELKLTVTNKNEAEKLVRQACESLLVNTIIEDYNFEIVA